MCLETSRTAMSCLHNIAGYSTRHLRDMIRRAISLHSRIPLVVARGSFTVWWYVDISTV